MVKVRPVCEGQPPTIGESWKDLPLDDAVRVLDISANDLFMELGDTPSLYESSKNIDLHSTTHIGIEISNEECSESWKAGLYKSPLSPEEALFRLQVHDELRHAWKDEWQKGEDADGEDAIYLWVSLKPDKPESEWNFQKRYDLLRTIQNIWSKNKIPEWVFIRFRKEEEAETS